VYYLYPGPKIGLPSKMAKKKKNTNSPNAIAEPVVLAESENEEEDDDEEEEEDMELLQVDVGDIVKLKQVLDESVAGTFLEVIDLPEDHRLDNIKLSIMTLACLFAVVAQFSPIPFPESRPMLGICCCMYFLLSGVLQLIVSFLDKDAIMTTLPLKEGDDRAKKVKDMTKYGLRIRTSLPRFDEHFTLIIEFEGAADSVFVKKTWSVGQFFDVEGMFDEIGLMDEVEAVYKRFASGNFDKKDAVLASEKKDN